MVLMDAGGLVLGTMSVGVLLDAEYARNETYLETVGAVLIALLLYWLAHSYAKFTAQRLQRSESLTITGLAEAMAHELPILAGAAVPLLVLLISWAAGATLATAVTAGTWTAAGIIFLIEVIAGMRARLSGSDLIAQALMGAALGLLVILVRIVLH
jgi:hypothetical protein